MPVEFTLQTDDGLRLYGRRWDVRSPKAVICLIHGLGEHSGRYQHVAEFFNRHGYSFAAFDLRGHGKSDGKRGHAEYERIMEDIALFLSSLDYECPRFVYGHSMGGNLAINFILRRRPKIAGAVISAPFLALHKDLSTGLKFLLKFLNAVAPSILISNGINPEYLSRDLRVVEEYVNDPLVHNKISPRLVYQLIEAGKWAVENAASVDIPVLLLHGDEDRIVSYGASRRFAERAGCKFISYRGFYHEPHNEVERERVLKDILSWIEEVLG
ncbi:alpha/beta hydrolase [Archaeoglobus neptunius]|uniref:alpha/beta hydrolase n=1 Tax=Archaeoglobus neptunius TaxID=2798580 RepID=UPI00192906E2|nr:alpha/beta hydrolase [Archaeoglobus neptunius]